MCDDLADLPILARTGLPAAVANGLSLSHLGAAAAGTTNSPLAGSLTAGGVGTFTVPRNVVITVTHASAVVAMSGTTNVGSMARGNTKKGAPKSGFARICREALTSTNRMSARPRIFHASSILRLGGVLNGCAPISGRPLM